MCGGWLACNFFYRTVQIIGVHIQVAGIILSCSQLQWAIECFDWKLSFQQFKEYGGNPGGCFFSLMIMF